MKILLVCNKTPYPKHDGGSVAIYNLAVSLSRLGQEVIMLSMQTEKHGSSGPDPVFIASGIIHFTVRVSTRISVTGLLKNLVFSRMPYIAQRFISPAFKRELIRVLQLHAIDVVQLEGAYMLPFAEVVRAHSEAVIAYRSHNIEHIIWGSLAERTSHPLKRRYLRILSSRLERFEKKFLDAYDLLLPMSRVDALIYQNMGNRRPAKICPVGYSTENISVQADARPPFSLFYLGSLDWIPNQEGLSWLVSEILPSLCKRHPDLLLYVAGRNAPASLIRSMQDDHIVFCGEVEDAGAFMRNKGIMMVPLFSGSGMRVKIIEAMAMGKPVVATSKAAEGIEVSPETDILLADQADDFILQTERLLQDPALYKNLSRNSRELVRKKYDNMKITADLVTFYQKHLK